MWIHATGTIVTNGPIVRMLCVGKSIEIDTSSLKMNFTFLKHFGGSY